MPRSTKTDEKGDIRSIKTNLTARLDRIPWNSWHTYIFAILFAGVILEGFSISLGGATLGALEKQFNLTTFEAVVLTPLYLVGALIGSFLMGTMADYIGRKKSFHNNGYYRHHRQRNSCTFLQLRFTSTW